MLHDFFGLTVSRAGLLGHLRWGGTLFAPVVAELLELLRQSPVVGGDETGWYGNGQTVWAWCFRDPRLALFLSDRHHSRAVSERVLGPSFAGTLVSDFYAAYHGLDCPKQCCLVHLLRELVKLREELPWQSVRAFLGPLLDLFRDALQLGKERGQRSATAFAQAHQRILDRFDDLLLGTQTQQPQCRRIWRRLFRHGDELFTFLNDPAVPAQQDRLLNLRLADDIDQATFARKSTEIRDRLASIKLQLDALDRSHDENAELASKVVELSQTLRQQRLTADYDAKRRILEIVCLNCRLDGATLVAEMRKPFDVLAEGLVSEKSRGDRRPTFPNESGGQELLQRGLSQTVDFTADSFFRLGGA